MARIKKIKEIATQEYVYPVTIANAVYQISEDGTNVTPLSETLSGIITKLDVNILEAQTITADDIDNIYNEIKNAGE